jgi:mercuric ion transport protein
MTGNSKTETRSLPTWWSFASLFTSVGTLLCCALPSLLVLLGLGATVASFLSAAPWLVALSHHKRLVFGVSGVLILTNFYYTYSLAPRLQAARLAREGIACSPSDPEACAVVGRFSRVVLWISAALWASGFFVAFVLGEVLSRLDH